MRRTPLLSLHESLGAEIGDFAGWASPLWFEGVRQEHGAVRDGAGIFDISHMTRTVVRGGDAGKLLTRITSYNVSTLKEMRMKYCLILNEDAGIIDDVTVLRVAGDSFLVVSNAATRERVVSWMLEHAVGDVMVEDVTESTALLAVQGPASSKHVSEWLGEDVSGMKWFSGRITNFGGCTVLVTRSGYTGEDGFEICILCGVKENYVKIFERFTGAGVKPCGLACRDILRLEAGYPLYGQDMDERTTPLEARLEWAVRLDNEFFIGRDRYLELERVGPSKLLVGLEMVEQGIPRHGYRVLSQNDDTIGYVTSGGYSYSLGKGIALGYIQRQHVGEGVDVTVDIRGRKRRAKIRLGPFVKPRIPKL